MRPGQSASLGARLTTTSRSPLESRSEYPQSVWLVESVDYSPILYGVWATRDEAILGIKRIYGPPYIVTWGEPTEEGDPANYIITGHFSPVDGHHAGDKDSFRVFRETVRREILTTAPPTCD